MRKLKTVDLVVSIIALIVIVALATTLGALQVSNVIDLKVNVYLLMMSVLTLGIGLFLTIYAIVKNAGYEYAIGGLILVIGLILLMVCFKLDVLVIVIIGAGLLAIYILSIFLLKANSLLVERTNEKEGFVPYMQQLNEQKQKEAEEEKEPIEIKSFKD